MLGVNTSKAINHGWVSSWWSIDSHLTILKEIEDLYYCMGQEEYREDIYRPLINWGLGGYKLLQLLPGLKLLQLLLSGLHYNALHAKTTNHRDSFLPRAVCQFS